MHTISAAAVGDNSNGTAAVSSGYLCSATYTATLTDQSSSSNGMSSCFNSEAVNPASLSGVGPSEPKVMVEIPRITPDPSTSAVVESSSTVLASTAESAVVVSGSGFDGGFNGGGGRWATIDYSAPGQHTYEDEETGENSRGSCIVEGDEEDGGRDDQAAYGVMNKLPLSSSFGYVSSSRFESGEMASSGGQVVSQGTAASSNSGTKQTWWVGSRVEGVGNRVGGEMVL